MAFRRFLLVMTAVVRYRRIQGQVVWIVLMYLAEVSGLLASARKSEFPNHKVKRTEFGKRDQ